jgi:hypothetical protein
MNQVTVAQGRPGLGSTEPGGHPCPGAMSEPFTGTVTLNAGPEHS